MQTLKFAAMRAGNDPDRDSVDHGTYYANNLPGIRKYRKEVRVTRGAWRKRGSK